MVSKKRIHNPSRYLFPVPPGSGFYVVVPLTEEDYPRLQHYGIMPDGKARIPEPIQSATIANADGKLIVIRSLPKTLRPIVRTYHVIDWHGNDHYGTCVQHRLCFPRKLLPPTNVSFAIEEGILFSPLFENLPNAMPEIKAAMNMALEMLGRFDIWSPEKAPILPPKQKLEVPWEILRAGTREQEVLRSYLEGVVKRKPKCEQLAIFGNHEHLQSFSPDFYVLGSQNFLGYVVYGFPQLNLFVFESNEINNATYVFRGDWESASQLTKTEVLSGGLQEARLYHTDNWKGNVSQLISRFHMKNQ